MRSPNLRSVNSAQVVAHGHETSLSEFQVAQVVLPVAKPVFSAILVASFVDWMPVCSLSIRVASSVDWMPAC